MLQKSRRDTYGLIANYGEKRRTLEKDEVSERAKKRGSDSSPENKNLHHFILVYFLHGMQKRKFSRMSELLFSIQ